MLGDSFPNTKVKDPIALRRHAQSAESVGSGKVNRCYKLLQNGCQRGLGIRFRWLKKTYQTQKPRQISRQFPAIPGAVLHLKRRTKRKAPAIPGKFPGNSGNFRRRFTFKKTYQTQKKRQSPTHFPAIPGNSRRRFTLKKTYQTQKPRQFRANFPANFPAIPGGVLD